MYDAFRKGRLGDFVAYTYPVVVAQMGGGRR